MTRVASARGLDVVRGEAVPLPFSGGEFERVFTAHFYDHLLPEERQPFLDEVWRVAPELVVVDSAVRADLPRELWQERRLEDGSVHKVYKRFFDGEELAAELGGGDVLHAGRWFVAVRVGKPHRG
jgi:hypothetical protein